MKNNDFIKMVKNDIARCDEMLRNNEKLADLQSELIGKYSMVSANFPYIEANPATKKHHPKTYRENAQKILGFLKAYDLNNCEDYRFDDTKEHGINVIVNSQGNSKNKVNIQGFNKNEDTFEKQSKLKTWAMSIINNILANWIGYIIVALGGAVISVFFI